jgi:hypothetical protein
MINLCWIEDGEWKKLELKYGDETLREVYRVERLAHTEGAPIAFLEHPVTYMLLPLFGPLLAIRREVKRLDRDEARMHTELARFIDSHDRSHRAFTYVSHQLQLADRDAQIAQLEASLATAVEMLNEEQEGPD